MKAFGSTPDSGRVQRPAAAKRWPKSSSKRVQLPFFLTMGSMLGFNARALTSAFVTAARRRGRRVIIQRGWAGLNFRGASDVLVVDEIDYAAVLPRCEAQFLHGGAGTVTAALRSGRPIALLPVMPDQVFWAKCLRHLGVCFGTLDPFSVLPQDFERLMRRELMNPKYRKAALKISARLAQNDGLSTACSGTRRIRVSGSKVAPTALTVSNSSRAAVGPPQTKSLKEARPAPSPVRLASGRALSEQDELACLLSATCVKEILVPVTIDTDV